MALFAFGIWETLFAAGVGVSIPVIIHLLNRRRYRIVTWAAMRFLLAAQRQNTRRMRIEQLVLLAIRALLVLLIILAMASVAPWAERLWAMFLPGYGGQNKGPSVRVHHVVVLDGSLSMNVGGDDGTAFDFAKQLAVKKIKDCSAGDGFSVLVMKEHPAWIVGETSYDARKVTRELEEVGATHGNASLPVTLNMVAAKLAENAQRFPVQAVYFFTDMQRATWTNVPRSESAGDDKQNNVLSEISKRAKLFFVDVGRDNVGNLAVTDLAIEDPFITTGMEVKILFAVQNFDQKEKKNLRIDLLVGRAKENAGDPSMTLRPVNQKLENLQAGERLFRSFTHRFTQPGTYAIQVKIDRDALPVDDVRTIIVTVKESIPLLLVNGKPSPDRFEQATEYLRFSLNPFPKGEEKKAPLRPHVVSAAQFDAMPESDVLGYDSVFFCDVGQISAGALRRLNMVLRLGGALVFSVGDQVADNLEQYNRLLFNGGQGILPAKLTQRMQDQFTLQAQPEDFKSPPLKVFADDDDRIGLHRSRFRQFIVAEPVSEGKVRSLLTFMREEKPAEKGEPAKLAPTNYPLLLEWNPPLPKVEQGEAKPAAAVKGPITQLRYRGKVILVTSTLNMDWNSWPGSPSYGAMMQEIARLAVSGKLHGQSQPVGSALEEFFPSGGLDLDANLVPPSPRSTFDANAPPGKPQRVRTQSLGEVSVFRWSETDLAGIYVLTTANDPREHLFAVNVPSGGADQRDSESDLTRLDREHLKDLFPGWDAQVVPDATQVKLAPPAPVAPTDANDENAEFSHVGPEIARWALLLVLVLMIVEVVLAWRFGHHSAVEGASEPPATGKLWPITVALVSGVIFAAVAFTLIHAARTGDFLGFLPDWVRAWAERWMGVPPAPPGEGTRWELEYRNFIRDSGSDFWPAVGIAVAALFLVFHVYREDGPQVRLPYKALVAGVRYFLILLTLTVLLPQLQLRFDRQSWPDIVMILDDSRSMGEADRFANEQVRERAEKLGDLVRKKIEGDLPPKIEALQKELAPKQARLEANPDDALLRGEVELLTQRLKTWQRQLADVEHKSPSWTPTRLQLVQALLAQPGQDWLHYLVMDRRTKVHIYHLDAQGRAIKLTSAKGVAMGEITEADPEQLALAHQGVAQLEAEGMDSRLGSAVRHVLDHYRGASLSAVIMFTDGITTRDETILQASEYAAQKGVPLFFVGIGDDHEVRDLRLSDLQVDDVVYVNDIVNFEARLTGHGYKDLSVPVILKVKDKNGKEKELSRTKVKVDEQGKAVRIKLQHQPTEVGRKQYIIEVDISKRDDAGEKPMQPGNLRLERAIDVMDSKLIKVLLVDGTARYEYRYLKALLEREVPDAKKQKSIDLRVVLLDADADFPATDKSALSDFPATREELNAYDVVILGDVDPRHAMLKEQRLRQLADFVRGEDAKGRKSSKTGGGLLFLAGARFNPHAFKGTPLADVMPIEPIGKPPVDNEDRTERFYLDLTPVGRQHNIFRFSNDEIENQNIWRQKLDKLYWHASGYRKKPLAEVLAVHPTKKATIADAGDDARLPLVVQQFVGSGRTMFFGFDETWRWRFREDEIRYNKFWIQTIRYLSRNRLTRTDLRLDRQTPYRVGEQIKVTVKFPDNAPVPGKEDAKQAIPVQVKVIVEYWPKTKDAPGEPETTSMTLAKQEGMTLFEGYTPPAREGKYRFWLGSPDVTKTQPDGEKPSAEANVELPPGELDKLRLNRRELSQAAEATLGGFYTLANADKLLEELPTANRVSLSTPAAPVVFWNSPFVLLLVLALLTSEWILRKRKHLL